MSAMLAKRPVQALLGVVALAIGLWLGLSAILGWPPFFGKTAPANVHIVLDRSSSMQPTFGDGTKTKLQAAVDAINKKVLPAPVAGAGNLGLRSYGGSCTGVNTQLDVPMDRNTQEKLRDQLGRIQVGGQTTLVSGIEAAIKDLRQSRNLGPGHNQIVVITGGGDICQAGDAAARIRAAMDSAGANVTFRFIGIGVPADQQAALNKLAQDIGARPPFYARTQADLEEELQRFAETLKREEGPKQAATPATIAAVPPLAATPTVSPSPRVAPTPSGAPAPTNPPGPTATARPTPTPPVSGQQAVVAVDGLMVSGTGAEGYYVYDQAGNEQLVGYRRTNSATELFPGTYTVKVGERSFTVSVKVSEQATVSP